jgi:hypothetical protein
MKQTKKTTKNKLVLNSFLFSKLIVHYFRSLTIKHLIIIMCISLILNGTFVYYFRLKIIYINCLNQEFDFNTSWFSILREKPNCKPYSILQVIFLTYNNLYYSLIMFCFKQAFINTLRDIICCISKLAGLSIKDFLSTLFSNFSFFEKLLLFLISSKIIFKRFRIFY